MSGTQENNLFAQNSAQEGQTGIDQKIEHVETKQEEKITPAQQMDNLLRGTSSGQMKREIEKLRKEAAKYRVASRTEAEQKADLQKKSEEIQKELDALKQMNRNLKVMRALDKAGCIKSDLVAKDIPLDCEDLEGFIESYRESNKFLFNVKKQTIGGNFKASGAKNLSPSQQMDAYIRAALGR